MKEKKKRKKTLFYSSFYFPTSIVVCTAFLKLSCLCTNNSACDLIYELNEQDTRGEFMGRILLCRNCGLNIRRADL